MLETESLPTHPMVILTPTTQGWRELREIQRLEGDEIDSDEGSESDSGPDGRRSSSASEGHPSRSSSMLLRFDSGSTAAGATSKRPPLRGSLSADYLGEELRHTPDPGSPSIPPDEEGESPDRPVFKPIIIAPSPVMPGDEHVPVQPDTPTRGGARQLSPVLTGVQRSESPDQAGDGTFSFSVFGDGDEGSPIGEDDSPVRFASIGRRESLRVSTKPEVRPGVPRTKTKRELERERLFKDLDDNIEAEGIESKDVWGGGVQEIGKGAGLEPRPSTADAVLEGRSGTHSEIELAKTGSLPIAPKPVQYGIRHAFRPSPLHASPLTVTGRLPTPGSPSAESSSPAAESPRRTPSPAQSAKLASLRDFARSLISPHPSHVKEKSRPSTPSPPKSPRSRRRDSPRVSLVAGRVVQPYAVPASTALPPDGSSFEKPSLQSFSPFRSPSSNATKFGRSPFMPPSFNRLDSTISLAPSIGAPSEPTTPTSETAGGVGGRGIDDYVILKEAGKGAYGLVMRAKVKGPRGDPVGVSGPHLVSRAWTMADESRKR